jgi:hypothetical protein
VTTMSEEETPAAQLTAIAALVFREEGVEALRELFMKPEFLFFNDEIRDIGDELSAHDLKDAADAVYKLAKDFPKLPRTNPYSPENPNYSWWEQTKERAERHGEAAEFRKRYRLLQKDRLRVERGLPTRCGSFTNERPWGNGDAQV